MTSRAKLFMHGRSQAVRLPKEFRLPGAEVRVSRVGGAVLLEPIEDGKPFNAEAFWAKIDALSGRAFPAPSDDDLRPERDDEPSFD
jgi:antitoxin VapB